MLLILLPVTSNQACNVNFTLEFESSASLHQEHNKKVWHRELDLPWSLDTLDLRQDLFLFKYVVQEPLALKDLHQVD